MNENKEITPSLKQTELGDISNRKKAIIWMLISSLASAFIGIFLKEAGEIPLFQKIFVRTSITSCIAFVPFITLPKKDRKIATPFLLMLRIGAGLTGLFTMYRSFELISLSDANIIGKFSSIILIALSFLFLKEPLNKVEFSAIAIGFLGVIFVSKPSFHSEIYGYLIAIFSSFCAAFAYLFIRLISNRIHPKCMVFYFAFISSIAVFPFAMNSWVSMQPYQWFFVTAAGIAGLITQYGLTFAYSYAPAKEVSIYSYTAIVFAAFYDIAHGMLPDVFSILGYFLIFGASLLLMKNTK